MDYTITADKLLFRAMSDELIRSTMERLDKIDSYTFWHSVSVARMSLVMGLTYGLKGQELNDLMFAALFHEIGMVEAQDELIRDKMPLTIIPKAKKLRHPVIGARMIASLGIFSEDVITAIRCHHENYDGSGVAYHQPGERVNLAARIIRICDVFDALTDDHSYAEEVIQKKILNVITASRGKELDPDIVSLFLFVKKHGKIQNRGVRRTRNYESEDFELSVG